VTITEKLRVLFDAADAADRKLSEAQRKTEMQKSEIKDLRTQVRALSAENASLKRRMERAGFWAERPAATIKKPRSN
jgi:regulator of replication initiation timing